MPSLILSCLSNAMEQNSSSKGFIISGFPRNLEQLELFEMEHGRQSDIVLLDCSELELGRTLGRREDIDDTVAACRRRLELYRTVTLPAAKALDDAHRLLVIDGDCDEAHVMDELKRCIYLELQQLSGHGPASAVTSASPLPGASSARRLAPHDTGQPPPRQMALVASEAGHGRYDDGPRHYVESAALSPDSASYDSDSDDSVHTGDSGRHSQTVGITGSADARGRRALAEVETNRPGAVR